MADWQPITQADKGPSSLLGADQFAPGGEPWYAPPRVEVVVTTSDLQRETLYAGGGAYGGIA